MFGSRSGPWRFRDRFGQEWSIGMVAMSDRKLEPTGLASWEDRSTVDSLVYHSFTHSGATHDEVASALLRVYDVLTGDGLSQKLTRPTNDPRRLLRDFNDTLRRTLLFAIASDRVRVERVERPPWPFADPVAEPVPTPPESGPAPDSDTFVGLRLVNQNQEPVPQRPYRIVLPDQSVHDGLTDADGAATLRDVSPGGLCRISCPFTEAHPSLTHEVLPGEHISGIAYAYGFEDYTVVWDDPSNADLASRRANAHELVPGDQVSIPALPDNATMRATGAVHTFVVRQSPLELRIQLVDLGLAPLAGLACTLDGADLATDGDGALSAPVAKSAQASFLSVDGVDLALQVGRLTPLDDESDGGWKARLYNLGFLLDPEVDDGDDELRIALQDFQAQFALPVTGALDDATKALIGQHYGC